MKQLAILGATGSIGTNTLAVVDLHPNLFKIFALSADKNWKKMSLLCQRYQPRFALMKNIAAAKYLQKTLKEKGYIQTEVLCGEEDLCDIVAHKDLDYVMAAIVGSAGMHSALASIKASKRLLLANKETLVLSGDLLMQTLHQSKAELLPVDSEHSAIFQCLKSGKSGLKKIQLTASGGPFLNTPYAELRHITPDEACAHPNWQMGRKISIDSATMMNKGLEIIEAHYLFGLSSDAIEVIIHPQSLVHSQVFYEDGSSLAQLSLPDMRTAITYALSYPNRINSGVADLDLSASSPLEFYQPNLKQFPCLKLSIEALKQGGNAMATLSSANEVAVNAFLNCEIGFLDIAVIIEETLEKHPTCRLDCLESIIQNDKKARILARKVMQNIS